MESDQMSFITCAAWVPKGVAKSKPDKVGVTPAELARIIHETRGNLEELDEEEEASDDGENEEEMEGDDDDDEDEDEDEKEEEEGDNKENKKVVNEEEEIEDNEIEAEEEETEETKEGEPMVEEATMAEVPEKEEGLSKSQKKRRKKNKKKELKKKQEEDKDDEDDVDDILNFDDYDKDMDNTAQKLSLSNIAVFANNDDDPHLTIKDADNKDSDDEDEVITSGDNLVAVGHVDGDAAILEVYVYNSEEGSFYVHHDILLPAIPLCMEWMNYDPGDEFLRPGNMLAIGSMSPVVEVWDLDIADSMEPAFALGKKGNKKKKIKGVGHKDAVLSLAWNTHAEHVLASGSVDQSVILWDMEHGTVAQQMKCFKEKVQTIKWHPTEAHTLLTGACDNKVRLLDCRSSDTFQAWKVDGEVESVVWDKHNENPYVFMASTDAGTVYAFDGRKEKPLWTLSAHHKSCTALSMSPTCPGCLVTASMDETIKVWDVASGKPAMVEEHKINLGVIHCLSACPDWPFVFCMGGDNKENNFKVWDIRNSVNVRTRFCPRMGMPTDEEMETEAATKALSKVNLEDDDSVQVVSGKMTSPGAGAPDANSKPKVKKFHKKKGGHLSKKKRW
ncbi:periodic tryptophan protein 1 homolog [Penaeus japonicus]|uniref:periodic tryptophan protein 1 homolog n=1 Tax=Penaeus japonicus TaxID=27405 RepID=UPI001C70E50A|nr:periodic tryptophan protein 1 homolog [Penaeus japonicus]